MVRMMIMMADGPSVVVTPLRPSWAPGRWGGQWLVRSHWSGFLPIPPPSPFILFIFFKDIDVGQLDKGAASSIFLALPKGKVVLGWKSGLYFILYVFSWCRVTFIFYLFFSGWKPLNGLSFILEVKALRGYCGKRCKSHMQRMPTRANIEECWFKQWCVVNSG